MEELSWKNIVDDGRTYDPSSPKRRPVLIWDVRSNAHTYNISFQPNIAIHRANERSTSHAYTHRHISIINGLQRFAKNSLILYNSQNLRFWERIQLTEFAFLRKDTFSVGLWNDDYVNVTAHAECDDEVRLLTFRTCQHRTTSCPFWPRGLSNIDYVIIASPRQSLQVGNAFASYHVLKTTLRLLRNWNATCAASFAHYICMILRLVGIQPRGLSHIDFLTPGIAMFTVFGYSAARPMLYRFTHSLFRRMMNNGFWEVQL